MEYIDLIFYIALGIAGGYTLLMISCTFYELKIARPAPPLTAYPGISILKPLKGVDDDLEANLRSFFNLDYPRYELIFGVAGADDAAVPVVRKLCREYPRIATRLVIEDSRIGLNPKVNNLYNMQQFCRHDYLLISDSNVRAGQNYLRDLMNHMDSPRVGLVTSTIRGTGARTPGSVFENLHLNSFVSPTVFTLNRLLQLPVTIGKSMLLRKSTLQDIGGLWNFRNVLAEDHLIGEAVRSLGLEVRISPAAVDNVNRNRALGGFLNRHIRWAKMRKNMNNLHYLLEVFSNPIAIAFVYAGLRQDLGGLQILLGISIAKTAADLLLMRLLQAEIRWLHIPLIPAKDLLIGLVWYLPFLSRTVKWRGNQFRISKNTQLLPTTEGV